MKYHCFALGCHDETDYPELFYQCYFCGHWFCQHHAEIHFKGLARKELRRGIKELKQKQADEASQRSVTNVLLKIENEKLIAEVERLRECVDIKKNYPKTWFPRVYETLTKDRTYQRRHRKWALEKARNTLFCERYEIEEWREALKEAEAELADCREQARLREVDVWQLEARVEELEERGKHLGWILDRWDELPNDVKDDEGLRALRSQIEEAGE